MSDAPTSPSSDPSEPTDRADRGGRAGPADTGRVRLDRASTELEVPPDAEVYACERCGERFPRERQRDLHLGLDHAGELTEAEREAYAAASAEEDADLRRFRIVALGVLVLLYFGFLMLYAVAGLSGSEGAFVPLVVGPPAAGWRPDGR